MEVIIFCIDIIFFVLHLVHMCVYVKDAIKIYVYNTFPFLMLPCLLHIFIGSKTNIKAFVVVCLFVFFFFIDICLILSQCVKRLSSFLVYFPSIFFEIVSVCRFHLLPFPLQRISNTYKEAFKNPENMLFFLVVKPNICF